MTDHRTRGLERRLAGGDPGAEAPLLQARLRAGRLDPDRLELAGYLGHRPALEALGERAPRQIGNLESWVRGLDRWGKPTWVRAAIAAARRVLPFWSWEKDGVVDPRPLEAIEAAEAWLRRQDFAHAELALNAADLAQLVLAEINEDLDEQSDFGHVDYAVVMAEAFRESRATVQAALAAGKKNGLGHAVQAAVAARERIAISLAPTDAKGHSQLHVRAAQADRLGQLPELDVPEAANAVREAIADSLVPWALRPPEPPPPTPTPSVDA